MIPSVFGPEITKIPLMDEVLRRHSRSIAEEEALGGQEERAEEVGRQEGEADAPQGRSPEV
jgi:hypothetical protein